MEFKNHFKLNLKSKENLYGYIFILPFIIGFIFFFLYPFLQAIIFSISKLKITGSGYETISVGLENYREALFVNADYVRNLVSVFGQMFAEVPVIIMFSFFAAVLLNQKFHGRWLARLLFFLPVILGSGVILRMEQWDVMHSFLETAGMGAVEEGGLFGPSVKTILIELNFPAKFVDFIVENVSRIPDILRASAVQIIVFLAGLQSIPSSLYEASKMEGASGWENFWLITFPLVSPLILTNIVYTVVDSFTAVDNEIVIMISEGAFGRLGFGQSTAMAMMYFAVIILLLGILIKVISRGVFYQE